MSRNNESFSMTLLWTSDANSLRISHFDYYFVRQTTREYANRVETLSYRRLTLFWHCRRSNERSGRHTKSSCIGLRSRYFAPSDYGNPIDFQAESLFSTFYEQLMDRMRMLTEYVFHAWMKDNLLNIIYKKIMLSDVACCAVRISSREISFHRSAMVKCAIIRQWVSGIIAGRRRWKLPEKLKTRFLRVSRVLHILPPNVFMYESAFHNP